MTITPLAKSQTPKQPKQRNRPSVDTKIKHQQSRNLTLQIKPSTQIGTKSNQNTLNKKSAELQKHTSNLKLTERERELTTGDLELK